MTSYKEYGALFLMDDLHDVVPSTPTVVPAPVQHSQNPVTSSVLKPRAEKTSGLAPLPFVLDNKVSRNVAVDSDDEDYSPYSRVISTKEPDTVYVAPSVPQQDDEAFEKRFEEECGGFFCLHSSEDAIEFPDDDDGPEVAVEPDTDDVVERTSIAIVRPSSFAEQVRRQQREQQELDESIRRSQDEVKASKPRSYEQWVQVVQEARNANNEPLVGSSGSK